MRGWLRRVAYAGVGATLLLAASLGGLPARASSAEAVTEAEVEITYGISAFNHGELREALRRFEAAARLDPENGTARHWLGLTRLRLGDARGAIADLEASLAAPRPPQAGEDRVRADLAVAQGQAKEAEVTVAPGGEEVTAGVLAQPLAEIRFGLGAIYDSNPAQLPDGAFLVDTDGQVLDGGDTAGSGQFRFELHPFYGKRGWSMGIRIDGYQSAYQDYDFLDLTQVGEAVQLAWGSDPLGFVTGPLGFTRVPFGRGRVSLLLQGGTTYTELDGDAALRTHEGAAGVLLRESDRTATQIEYDYRDQTSWVLPSRTGHETSLRASQYIYVGRPDRYVRLGVRAGEARAAEFFDESFLEESVELALPLPGRPVLYVLLLARQDDYDEASSNPLSVSGEPREDSGLVAAASLIWPFGSHSYLTVKLTSQNQDVGLDAFDLDYDRTIGTAGMTWFF